MKYFVSVGGGGDTEVLDLEDAPGPGAMLVTGADGESVVADLNEVAETPIALVRIGESTHRVQVRRGAGRGLYTLWIDGWRFEVEALDERTKTIRELAAAAGGPSGPAPVVAPMPGLIVRVNVVVGDIVQAGQGLVVMEAMKMENELRASAGGRVKAITVVAGTAVEKGTLLVSLEQE